MGTLQNLIRNFSKFDVADVIVATVAMLLEFAPKYDPLYES